MTGSYNAGDGGQDQEGSVVDQDRQGRGREQGMDDCGAAGPDADDQSAGGGGGQAAGIAALCRGTV